MTGSADGQRVAAATVLFRPTLADVDGLLTPLAADGLDIFVFANGPLADAVERRLAGTPKLVRLAAPDNIGLGAGLNAVMAVAAAETFDHVLLFDQDSTPQRGLAEALLVRREAAAAAGERPAAVAPVLVPPPGENYLPIRYARRRPAPALPAALRAVDFLPTSGSLVSLAAFERAGPFRADYFVDGIDVEWCFRAWGQGLPSLLAEDLAMVHRWGHADPEDRRPQILRQSPVRLYYYARNAAHGLRLPHVPPRWKARTVARLAVQGGLILRGGWRHGAARIMLRAVRDGCRGRLGPLPPDAGVPVP